MREPNYTEIRHYDKIHTPELLPTFLQEFMNEHLDLVMDRETLRLDQFAARIEAVGTTRDRALANFLRIWLDVMLAADNAVTILGVLPNAIKPYNGSLTYGEDQYPRMLGPQAMNYLTQRQAA